MAQSFVDLIPWEINPKDLTSNVFTVEWNDGSFTVPKYGYLEVGELNRIRQVDPSNALYRLTSRKAIELNKALIDRSDNDNSYEVPVLQPRQCFALLSSLLARHMGAAISLDESEDLIQICFSHIIGPYLDEGKNLSESIPIRSVSVILQRIRPGWTDDETRKLPPALFNLIHELYQEEEAGGQKPLNTDEQIKELEETLGKLRADVRSIAIDQTGQNSSGNAEGFGQEPRNLNEQTMVASLDSSSSKRSKLATRQNGKRSTSKS